MIDIDRALREVTEPMKRLFFASKSLGFAGWENTKHTEDWMHDLAVMRQHDDLRWIALQFLGRDRSVLSEYKIEIEQHVSGRLFADSAAGIELPLLPPGSVSETRMLFQRDGKEALYKQLLRLNWGTASDLPKRSGATFDGEFDRARSGGRLHGKFHVAAEARHELIVTQVGARGYAFAKDLTFGVDGVFLHVKFAPPGHEFRTGSHLTAIIIQSPKGLQARDIHPA